MTEEPQNVMGRVTEIWRYPVKSMLGEQLNATAVTDLGVLGDRAFALVDIETGKVVSAKNPKRWPNMFGFRATFTDMPSDPKSFPAVRITLPNGSVLSTDQVDAESQISAALGRPVRLVRSAPKGAAAEGYWPDVDWLVHRDEVFEFSLPPGTFFDGAAVHMVTTSTLDRLQKVAPESRFEVPRFRPNFVIATTERSTGFIENEWIGRTLALGTAKLRIDGPCPRCIMTTLSQGGLPKDPNVLRTAVMQNSGNVGVYATVVQGGTVSCGDEVEQT
jgi:MOSC domain-containing protein